MNWTYLWYSHVRKPHPPLPIQVSLWRLKNEICFLTENFFLHLAWTLLRYCIVLLKTAGLLAFNFEEPEKGRGRNNEAFQRVGIYMNTTSRHFIKCSKYEAASPTAFSQAAIVRMLFMSCADNRSKQKTLTAVGLKLLSTLSFQIKTDNKQRNSS